MKDRRVHCFHNCRILRDGCFVQDELWVLGSKVISADMGRACGLPIVRKNCYNKIVAPGFIDIQMNGAYGMDFTATDDVKKCLSQCSLLLTQTGVTSYCPTIITSDPSEYKHRLAQIPFTPGSQERGATVLGVHTEGPFISMQKRGCHPPAHIKSIPHMESVEEAKKLLDETYGPDRSNIVMLTLAPEYEGAKEVITALAQEGIVVSMGHSESSYVTGCAGVAAGARALTHLFSAMNAFGHKEPALPGMISGRIPEPPKLAELKLTVKFQEFCPSRDSVEDAMVSGGSVGHLSLPRLSSAAGVVSAEDCSIGSEYCSTKLHYGLIADCVHTHPYSLTIAYRANRHGLCLITDAMAALGLPDGEYRLGDTEVVVGGTPRRALKKGTDTLAGVVASLDHCVRLFTEQTQCGLPYALTAASLHPARCLGISEWKGHLGVGADADIILIDDDVKIFETWCMGEKAYDIVDGLSAPDLPSNIKALAHVVPPESLTHMITY